MTNKNNVSERGAWESKHLTEHVQFDMLTDRSVSYCGNATQQEGIMSGMRVTQTECHYAGLTQHTRKLVYGSDAGLDSPEDCGKTTVFSYFTSPLPFNFFKQISNVISS